MSSTSSKLGPTPALKSLLSRETTIVAVALAAAAAVAWAWLLNAGSGGMPMGTEPLSPAYLLPAFAMWAMMMVAMMVPSAAPMILLRARIDKCPNPRSRAAHTTLFVLAYLLVWTGFSATAAVAQALLVRFGLLSAMGLSIGNRVPASFLLLVAAAYELTSAKRLCLDTCQSPLIFVLKHHRPGATGALRLGFAHGLFCLGCCWALMLLLFVGGVMNLAWVALLGIIVLGEKFAPPAWHSERYVAGALALAAAALLLAD